MALAFTGMLLVGLIIPFQILGTLFPPSWGGPVKPEWKFVLLLGLPYTLVHLWMFWRLRLIGRTLHRQPGISADLGSALRWLAHALVGVAVIGLFLPAQPSKAALPSGLLMNSGSLYLIAVACLVLYALANVIAESVRIQQENEAFV